jgi:hypothetical protein
VPTIDQIIHVLRTMPDYSDINRRDRAVVAFTLLTGIRDRALVSLSLKHVHLERLCVVQDAREVQTPLLHDTAALEQIAQVLRSAGRNPQNVTWDKRIWCPLVLYNSLGLRSFTSRVARVLRRFYPNRARNPSEVRPRFRNEIGF